MSKKLPRRNCLYCNKECNRPEKFYCNVQCQQNSLWEERKHLIELTGQFVPTEGGRLAKRYLREKHGCICQICKLSDWYGQPIPLVLDHINGQHDDWNVSNCRLICPNCDTFTPFYKGRNKGNGRFKRQQRYKSGQSF